MSRSLRIGVDARLLALGLGLLGVLALAAGWLGWQRLSSRSAPSIDEVLRNPKLRSELLMEMAKRTTGEFDSHPDASLGHVSLFGNRKSFHGQLRVNERGIRERDYALPKPPGTLRIVLLGDSFVFGWQVEEEQRLGAHLERFLRERGHGFDGPIEVLHFGVISWGIQAECAFLLRQLEQLQPDLVLHITLSNDLDDPQAIRGHGALANFPTQGRGPGNSLVYLNYPKDVLGFPVGNYLPQGWGYESLSRFKVAQQALVRLRRELEQLPTPAGYLLVVNWQHSNATFHQHMGRFVDPESLFYLPISFWDDPAYRVGPDDAHWNAQGHELVARLLYAVIRERGLLPGLTLDPWPEAERIAHEFAEEGWSAATKTPSPPMLSPVIEVARLEGELARQILGGLDREGFVAPYASLLLGRRPTQRELVLAGRFLPDQVLRDESVQVFLDELEVEKLVIQPGQTFELHVPLPAELGRRPVLNVRFRSEDFVYRGSDLRQCVVFQLERVALE